MGKLYVGTPDNADGFYNGVGLFFQLILDFLGDRQHRSGTEGISRMYSHGIDVFNKTYRNLLPLCVTDNFYFQFFPADDRFFDEDLVYHRSGDASGGNLPKFFFVIDNSSSGSAHGIGRTDNTGISQFSGDLYSLFHGIGRGAFCHFDPQLVHSIFKLNTVLTPADSVYLDTDDFYMIFIQHPCMIQLLTEIQSRLSSQVREKSIRPFLCDDLCETVYIQRLDVSYISGRRIRHNSGRIGIYQHDLIAKAF